VNGDEGEGNMTKKEGTRLINSGNIQAACKFVKPLNNVQGV
jgi:hypothetical protein